MDNIILSFTPEQYEKYLEIRNRASSGQITLDFDFSQGTPEKYSMDSALKCVEKIRGCAASLLKYEHTGEVFPVPLTRAEIDELATAYFSAVGEMDAEMRVLYSELGNIFSLVSRLDGERNRLCAAYAQFLPYKAALCDTEHYSARISELDGDFQNRIYAISEAIKNAEQKCAPLLKICEDTVPEFFASSALACDSPRFEKFGDRDFFKSVRVFLDKVNSAISNISSL
ncbi:MAG: hypothetical protein ACI3XL_02880 [Eubacteriales bacterium]